MNCFYALLVLLFLTEYSEYQGNVGFRVQAVCGGIKVSNRMMPASNYMAFLRVKNQDGKISGGSAVIFNEDKILTAAVYYKLNPHYKECYVTVGTPLPDANTGTTLRIELNQWRTHPEFKGYNLFNLAVIQLTEEQKKEMAKNKKVSTLSNSVENSVVSGTIKATDRVKEATIKGYGSYFKEGDANSMHQLQYVTKGQISWEELYHQHQEHGYHETEAPNGSGLLFGITEPGYEDKDDKGQVRKIPHISREDEGGPVFLISPLSNEDSQHAFIGIVVGTSDDAEVSPVLHKITREIMGWIHNPESLQQAIEKDGNTSDSEDKKGKDADMPGKSTRSGRVYT